MSRAIYKESSRINLILRKKEYRQSNQSLSPATFLVSLVPRTVTIHRNPRHSLQKAYPECYTFCIDATRARSASPLSSTHNGSLVLVLSWQNATSKPPIPPSTLLLRRCVRREGWLRFNVHSLSLFFASAWLASIYAQPPPQFLSSRVTRRSQPRIAVCYF